MTLELLDHLPVEVCRFEPAWEEVVSAWLLAVTDSASTRRVYGLWVRRALGEIGVTSVPDLSPRDLLTWRARVMKRTESLRTKIQRITALRSFLRWTRALRMHGIDRELMDVVLRVPRESGSRPRDVVTDEMARRLYLAVRPRYRPIVAVMLGAGLRLSEVHGLDVRDLRETGPVAFLDVRHSKGNRSRQVPLTPDLAHLVGVHIREDQLFGHPWWPMFTALPLNRRVCGEPPPRISKSAIADALQAAELRARLAVHVHPHALRHTFATRQLRAGVSVEALRRVLGHANLTTTQRYLDHLTLEEIGGALVALPWTDSGWGESHDDRATGEPAPAG